MTKKIQQKITTHISQNRIGYLLSAIYIILGLISGAVVGSKSASSPEYISAFYSAFSLHGADTTKIFLQSFYSNSKIILLLWLSGWLIWLYPINILELVSKGFGIGYTTTYITSSMGLKGFLLASTALTVQNLLVIPILIVYSAVQLKFSISFYKIKTSASAYKQRKKFIQHNIAMLIIFFIVIFICCLLEAYIIPKLITVICCNFA